ncbi:MAG: STAS domain-containing protein [Chloroflexi bacterium]|nr:STAS domain-containing protein [Chloroflexota bacterium]
MSRKCLETNVRHQAGVAIIDLRGQVNAAAEGALNAAFSDANSQNPACILLNFGNVDYINSTGIALIVSLLAQARKAGCRLLTCGLSDHYVEIFRMTRLADFMGVFADEASALSQV